MSSLSAAQKAFSKLVPADKDGNHRLNLQDFRTLLLRDVTTKDLDELLVDQGVKSLFKLADRGNKGYVSLEDLLVFEDLLSSPDAEYQLAFRLFDLDGDGKVTKEDFVKIVSLSSSFQGQIILNEEIFQGLVDPATSELSYQNFSQLLKSLDTEKVKLAFKLLDPEAKGAISSENFALLFATIQKKKMTKFIQDHLQTLHNFFQGRPVTYASVLAFNNLLHELDFIDGLVKETSEAHPKGFTREEFVKHARSVTRFSRFSPLEFDLLFHFASLENKTGRFKYEDFDKILDPHFEERKLDHNHNHNHNHHPAQKLSFGASILKQMYSFGLGSIAGAIGATTVYPIDLVKTRMQNQRKIVGEILYKNSWDCFKKVLKNEGFFGLYRGLGPQLIGVAPEKAIKLTVNDFMRDKFTDADTGKILLLSEILSGGMAGGCQVIFTNPLEIVKIRLQVQGELAASGAQPPVKAGAVQIVRQLGLVGLYKGASACLLRDIPFSAIYFPAYAHIKIAMGEKPDQKLSGLKLLLSGALAGMPAAYFCTPADVIKTRLQVEARKGQQTYKGIADAAIKIYKQEGWTAFFKGGPARVLRSSPQFGVTLLSYEILQRNFPFPTGEKQVSEKSRWNSAHPTIYDTHLNVTNTQYAFKVLQDIDYKFGVWAAPHFPQHD